MRIVIVNPVWDPAHSMPGEALKHFTTLTGWATAVRAAGAESVTVCQRFHTSADISRDGVTYRFCPDHRRATPRRATRGSLRFHRAVLDADPDVVHVNGLLFPELIRSLRRALPESSALVVQDHGGFDPSAASTLARVWTRRGLAAADAVLVSSTGQADALRQSGIAPPETMIADVMESSTTLHPIPRMQARATLGLAGDPALLWVGRLNENKDPITVLSGLAEWLPRWPRATLTMVFQSGVLEGPVRRLVASTPELASRVTIVGAVPHSDIAAYYSAADIFVLGSHQEGSGYAVIEALACGTVPVVSDIAPFRSLTDDGAVGAVWEPGNTAAFQSALNRVMSRSLGDERRAARDLFARAFSWPVIGQRAVAVYQEVLASRGRARASGHTHTPA